MQLWPLRSKCQCKCFSKSSHNRYDELVEKYKVNYILGGAGQNAMRVMSWMLQEKEVGVFCGCVGKDKFGEQMEKEAKEAGVNVQLVHVLVLLLELKGIENC
jgi:sugar/nucleoside kinase (ribokinase family)